MLSANLETTLHRALALATERRHEYATLEHLLHTLAEDADARPLMVACGLDPERLRGDLISYIDGELAALVTQASGDAKPTTEFQRTLQRAAIHVLSTRHDEVTGAHVLVALFSERDSAAVRILTAHDITREAALAWLRAQPSGASDPRSEGGGSRPPPDPETATQRAFRLSKLESANLISAALEQTLQRALALAVERRHEYATLEHLLLALTEDSDALRMFAACNVDVPRLRHDVTAYIDDELTILVSDRPGDAKPTAGFRRTLQRAAIHVQSAGREEITGANLVIAMFSERESNAVYFLQDQEMSRLDAVNFFAHGITKARGAEPGDRERQEPIPPRVTPSQAAASGLAYWIRRSPFFEAARRHGARHFAVANHMYQPSGYDDPVAEYWKLVEGVTLWDVGTERQVEVTGRDARAFAELLTPRDLSKLQVGRCRYVVVTSQEGGIVNDPVLLRLGRNRFWFSTSDSDLLLWAKGVAIGSGLKVKLAEPDVSPIQIQGPKSPLVIEALFGPETAALGYYHLRETELDGMPLVLTRTGWSGGLGYEIFLCDGSFGERLWERVLEAGRPHGIAVTGPSDIRRVEAGILGYHGDMDLSTNPFEVGLERLVDLDKPADFIGKAALQRIARKGVTRRLIGIEIPGEPLTAPFETRWPVVLDGSKVGDVTIALHSPGLARNIGYAMVPVALAALGTKLAIETPWGETGAMVVRKPFVTADR